MRRPQGHKMQRMTRYLLVCWPSLVLAQEMPLPPTDLPALPASPASAAEEAPAVTEENQTPPAAATTAEAPAAMPAAMLSPLSFGDFPYSLTMTPAQADAMKAALTGFEKRIEMPKVEEEVVIDTTPKVEPDAPASYPVFTLGSVAFRTASDWTVWLNGVRITPSTNMHEVKVAAIGPQMVRFAWTPSYLSALRERARLDKFADSGPVAHKRTNPNTAVFDREGGVVYFALRPNQSFAAGYMATFEGRIASPALEKLVDETVPAAATDAGAATQPTQAYDDLSPTQQKNMQGLGSDTIRSLYEKASHRDAVVVDEGKAVQGTVDTLLQNQQNITNATPKRQ